MITTIKREIEEAAPAVARTLLKHHRLLYEVGQNQHLVPLATGLLLRVERRHFLITAAHVLDANNEHPTCDLATHGRDGLGEAVILHGESFRTVTPEGRTRLDDRLDVGFIALDAAVVEQIGEDRFMGPELMDLNDAGCMPALYGALGYPEELNLTITPTEARPVTKVPFLYTSVFDAPEEYQRIGVSPNTHLLMHASNKKTRAAGDIKMKLPDLHGMSGGGCWRLTEYGRNPTAPRLLAMTIEWRRWKTHGLLASRMNLVVQALRAAYPDLSPRLARSGLANITTAVLPRR